MKLKFKITRTVVVIALIAIGIAMTFLTFWLFNGNTKLFNDTVAKSDWHAGEVLFGWIHCAINLLVIVLDIIFLIYAVWEFSNDNPPFKFLYDKEEYYSDRRPKAMDEEETPAKPVRWKRWIWLAILLVFLVTTFKSGKTIFKQSVAMFNTSKKYHNTYQQKVEEKLGFYDKLWKTYQTKAQITNMNKDVFIEVTKIIMANVADGENLSWKWVQRYPDVDYNQFTAFYADLSNYIETQRDGYFSIEKTCQLIANQNNTMLDTFPNNIYNKVLKLERINFQYGFLSDSTNNVFAKGIENIE
jgi:hypothetical protein